MEAPDRLHWVATLQRRRAARAVGFAGVLLALAVITTGLMAGSQEDVDAAICNDIVPTGALPPAVPAWCQEPLQPGPATFALGGNSWVDDFDHGLSHAELGDGYLAFDRQGVLEDSIHFRHNEHWMVDIQAADGDFGGATMRPDRSFRFEDGLLVIEADVAAGVSTYLNGDAGDEAWVEIGVTTAEAPTGDVVDPLYAYGLFGGHHSVGCRLEASREVICALYPPDGERTWEMSWFQHIAPTVYGGYPSDAPAEAWRTCEGTDPDLECRDSFRLELTSTSLVLYVNGVRYFEQSGTDLLPDELVEGDVYVYFGDWVYKPSSEVIRFHWDRLAVNPGSHLSVCSLALKKLREHAWYTLPYRLVITAFCD